MPIAETKYKRSSSIFLVTSIALICGRVWTQLLQPLAQSLIGSPGTLGGWVSNQRSREFFSYKAGGFGGTKIHLFEFGLKYVNFGATYLSYGAVYLNLVPDI